MIKFYDEMGAEQGINMLNDIVDALDFWQVNTEYAEGAICRSTTNSMIYAKCTVAGTSGISEPEFIEGDKTITEATGVVWQTYDMEQTGGLNLLKRNHEYAKGDIAYSRNLPSWAYLECTSEGNSSSVEIEFSPAIKAGDSIVDGSVEWKVKDIKAGGSNTWQQLEGNAILPKDLGDTTVEETGMTETTLRGIVTEIVNSKVENRLGKIVWRSVALPSVVGELLADGSELSREMYPDLNALYASQGYPWGDGDGSTTFNLPNLIGRFAEGAENAGRYHEAGLPNISGSFGGDNIGIYSPDVLGAFVQGASETRYFSGVNGGGYNVDFDASKSNPIYGNSNTVQPNSALLIPYVVAFADQTAGSALVDVTQYAQELANKVNRSEADYVVDSYSDNDGNWWRQYKSGWLEQGGFSIHTTATGHVVNFLKPFAIDSKPTAVCAHTRNKTVSGGTDASSDLISIKSVTETGIFFGATTNNAGTSIPNGAFRWVAYGQGAEL